MNSKDRKLGMNQKISRRDVLHGVGAVAAVSFVPGRTFADEMMAIEKAGVYPPALTGLRGNHPGSFDVAHKLAKDGNADWGPYAEPDSDIYDLVVVGGGISGLAAAHFYRKSKPDARILILDNHDDFGGHAKRNEFEVDGKTLIGYGGSQTIQNPGSYSPQAKKLLRDIHIEPAKFYEYFDQDFYGSRDLGFGIYFSAEQYGKDSIHPIAVTPWEGGCSKDAEALINGYPLSSEARLSFVRLLTGPGDLLPGMSDEEKTTLMRRISYSDFLREHLGVHEKVVTLLRDFPKGLWGCGYDALSALEGYRLGMPGTWDIFDGQVARVGGKASKFGSFYDSTLDRISEIVVFLGLLSLYNSYAREWADVWMVYVIFVAMGGSIMVSYTRARAEGLGLDCKVGLLQRPERVVLLGLGSLGFGLMWNGIVLKGIIIVVAVLTSLTAIQRIIWVYRNAAGVPVDDLSLPGQ